MRIYVNENNEIKDVGVSKDTSLFVREITEDNPFEGWSVAKICCYKAEVEEGRVVMMTPYVDTRLIEHIDALGKECETNATDITDNRIGIEETYETTSVNTDDISDLRKALEEVYEMLLEGE